MYDQTHDRACDRTTERKTERTTERTTERPKRTTEPPKRTTKQCLKGAASVHPALQNCSIQARASTNPFGGPRACAMITDKILNETVLGLPKLRAKIAPIKAMCKSDQQCTFQHKFSTLGINTQILFVFPHNLLCASLRHVVFLYALKRKKLRVSNGNSRAHKDYAHLITVY